MVWAVAEEKVVGTVDIAREGVEPTPVPVPEPVIPVPVPIADVVKDFVREHAALKRMIDGYGDRGLCVTKETLISDSKLPVERLDKHLEVFKDHDVVTMASEDTICGRASIRELKKRLEVEL